MKRLQQDLINNAEKLQGQGWRSERLAEELYRLAIVIENHLHGAWRPEAPRHQDPDAIEGAMIAAGIPEKVNYRQLANFSGLGVAVIRKAVSRRKIPPADRGRVYRRDSAEWLARSAKYKRLEKCYDINAETLTEAKAVMDGYILTEEEQQEAAGELLVRLSQTAQSVPIATAVEQVIKEIRHEKNRRISEYNPEKN